MNTLSSSSILPTSLAQVLMLASSKLPRTTTKQLPQLLSYVHSRSYCTICNSCHKPVVRSSPGLLPVSQNLSLSKKHFIIRRTGDYFGSSLKLHHQLTARFTSGLHKRLHSKTSVAGAEKPDSHADGQKNTQQKVFVGDGGEGPVLHYTSHAALVLTSSIINRKSKQMLNNSSSEASAGDSDESCLRVNFNANTQSTVEDVNIVNRAKSLSSNNSTSNGSKVTKEQSDVSSPGAHSSHEKEELLTESNSPASHDVLILHNLAEGVSSKELLSHTTAFVRRATKNQELDPYDSPLLPSTTTDGQGAPDVEYVVEVSPRTDSITRTGLSGALPAASQEWRVMTTNTAALPGHYAALAKSRLTGLVVATALGGYVLAPAPLCAASLVGVCLGTGLISAAANTTNQILEAPYDAQMKRTSNRVLVRGHVTPLHAAVFAGVCGTGGLAVLWGACNPLTAGLGAVNLILYTALYTPMKRRTIANTWMGAVVGAIPPLMGWCASSGSIIGYEACGAWLMAGLLFAWQFPHFNALSWNLRPDYSRAGYRMMCVTDPRLCKVTCVRYSLAMLALGLAAPLLDVTTWTFAVDSTPLNGLMLYLSYRFYRDGDSRSSRNLFRFSLVHLPAVIVLMIISKKYNKEGTTTAAGAVAAITSTAPHGDVFNSNAVKNENNSQESVIDAVVAEERQVHKDTCNLNAVSLGLSSTAADPAAVVTDIPMDTEAVIIATTAVNLSSEIDSSIDSLHLLPESNSLQHQSWSVPVSPAIVMHSARTGTRAEHHCGTSPLTSTVPGQTTTAPLSRVADSHDQLSR